MTATHAPEAKFKKGRKGPATKRKQRARREQIERHELDEKMRRRRYFADRYDR